MKKMRLPMTTTTTTTATITVAIPDPVLGPDLKAAPVLVAQATKEKATETEGENSMLPRDLDHPATTPPARNRTAQSTFPPASMNKAGPPTTDLTACTMIH